MTIYNQFSFISIGKGTSDVLRILEISKLSLPFDHVITNLDILDHCFQTGFSKYHKNLRLNPAHTRMIDEYGFVFRHDYPLVDEKRVGDEIENIEKRITPDWREYYPVVKEKYERRIERFLEIMRGKKPIIILSRFSAEQINVIYDTFYRNYRRKDIYIVNSCQIESIGQKYINCFTEKNGIWNEASIWRENIDLIIYKYNEHNHIESVFAAQDAAQDAAQVITQDQAESQVEDIAEIESQDPTKEPVIENKANNPIGLLENTIFINLAYRTDRLAHVLEQLKGIGIHAPERLNAIKMNMGCVGCTMSHIKCLEIAKTRGWPYVFICEDDIKFINPALFLEKLAKFSETKWKWDVLIIGGNNLPPFLQVSDFAVRVFDIQTTTGYIVNGHYYDALIANFKEGLGKLIRDPQKKKEFAVDIYWKTLQKSGNWFFLIPPSVIQYSDYSDIEGKVTNYEGHFLDLDKQALIEYMMKMQNKKSIFSMNIKI